MKSKLISIQLEAFSKSIKTVSWCDIHNLIRKNIYYKDSKRIQPFKIYSLMLCGLTKNKDIIRIQYGVEGEENFCLFHLKKLFNAIKRKRKLKNQKIIALSLIMDEQWYEIIGRKVILAKGSYDIKYCNKCRRLKK